MVTNTVGKDLARRFPKRTKNLSIHISTEKSLRWPILLILSFYKKMV